MSFTFAPATNFVVDLVKFFTGAEITAIGTFTVRLLGYG